MPTAEDVITQVLAAADVSAEHPISYPLVLGWINYRYRQLTSRTRFRHRRQMGTINISARINTGTVTAALGSTTITADADAQAVIAAVTSIVGRYIRVTTGWYEITAYAAGTITIASAFTDLAATSLTGTVSTTAANATVTGVSTLFLTELAVGDQVVISGETKIVQSITNDLEFVATTTWGIPNAGVAATLSTFRSQTYDIVQKYYELAAAAQWLGRFRHARLSREIINQALAVFDINYPDRPTIGTGPDFWAEAGRGSNDRIQVEFYPYSALAETVNYVYWDKPTALVLATEIPAGVPEYVLTEGVLINLYRYLSSQEANRGNAQQAEFWANESRRQATSWERQVLEAAKADRPVDDITFLLQHLGQVGSQTPPLS